MKTGAIRFVTSNKHKITEAQEILALSGAKIRPITLKIEELQTEDTARLVKDKTVKAFEQIGHWPF